MRRLSNSIGYDQPTTLQVIANFDEFQKLRYAWNKLLAQSRNDKVFLTHEWFSCWWQTFGKRENLFTVLLKSGDEIVGIAPLMMHRSIFRGMPVRCLKFLESDDSPGCGFIIKRDHEQLIGVIISFLINDVKNWDILFFKNMLDDTEITNAILRCLDRAERKYIIKPGLSSPYIKINSEWEAYFKSISSKSRKTIRNICNRIKKLGDIRVEKLNDIKNFDDLISISKKGWKYKKGKAFINREERQKFFESFSEVASKNGWLSVWCMYKDNEPLAYEYHLKYKNKDTALLSEFNSEYENFSPGAFLDYEIVKSLFNNGIQEYDMCGSQDEYKKKWTEDIKQYKNLIIFNDSVYSKLLYLLEEKPIKLIKIFRDRILNVRN